MSVKWPTLILIFTPETGRIHWAIPIFAFGIIKIHFLGRRIAPKVFTKKLKKMPFLMFLLIEPSIFIRLSSVIPFWKAEGLTILMVWITFDEKLWPMRNQHLKIGYPSGCNFWLRPRTKKILSQNTPFLHDIFGT